MEDSAQKIIDSMIGKRVKVLKGHPHEGELGSIAKFFPIVGITGKPGFEVKGDNGESFFIFSSKEIEILNL